MVWVLGEAATRLKPTTAPKNPSRRCPNCRGVTEKIGSSNHLSCKNCKVRFCFVCMAQVKKANLHYFPGSRCKLMAPTNHL